ncbi:MAG: saccharopine dehydrogenase NADP-binding domain-containing protein [Hydrococcus sp. C42_A2020_068]|uniref:saccharopine dehydrogenase family protein n=1 Tax=Pleurocapsa sp. PCC 7327 TaxID=118163 RepID=UPI00029F83B1|nr:saccharopine dehydrogenase NADP-binding domain-containing protein [Pleurocapsa sp. PCC 7327]AFY77118.1 saccharopine dehydrogenase-like oxidoreductase [Pleurocapsa sp. PCC 7327]MBF2019377.1 saccharopine dehydrogenase NADP-binding domain-containing protein [Hydrococcus sp. C42_A2020_068]
MTKKVLIIGGCGRIGSSVAQDIANHTDAEVIVTGRQPRQDIKQPLQFLALDLEDLEGLRAAIATSNLVIHCAGPFHYRDGRVLKTCIEQGVNYIDVSDHRSFYQKVINYRDEAKTAGITAILNTGVFPGISNSMVRQGIEQLDAAETIHLSYVVAGSGGAGITVMRTTFLGLQQPFEVWIDGKWQKKLPYTQREVIEFPKPYGKTGVYWFDVPETYTFAESFPVKNVITKFGSVPDLYNHLTWITAHVFPSAWVKSKKGVEFFSHVGYKMTSVTDRFSGIGVAMRTEISGKKGDRNVKYYSTMVHENTAIAAGYGTGGVAQLVLAGKLHQPGIFPVEQVLPTNLFEETMASRGIKIHRQLNVE